MRTSRPAEEVRRNDAGRAQAVETVVFSPEDRKLRVVPIPVRMTREIFYSFKFGGSVAFKACGRWTGNYDPICSGLTALQFWSDIITKVETEQ